MPDWTSEDLHNPVYRQKAPMSIKEQKELIIKERQRSGGKHFKKGAAIAYGAARLFPPTALVTDIIDTAKGFANYNNQNNSDIAGGVGRSWNGLANKVKTIDDVGDVLGTTIKPLGHALKAYDFILDSKQLYDTINTPVESFANGGKIMRRGNKRALGGLNDFLTKNNITGAGIGSALGGAANLYGTIAGNLKTGDLQEQEFRATSKGDLFSQAASFDGYDLGRSNTAGSALSGAAAGASIGSVAGPIGSAIGGAVGAVGGFVSSIFGNKKRKRAEERANQRALNAIDANNTLINTNIINDTLANQLAFGGGLNGYGANFSNGLTVFGSGGKHESNPYGGIPQGIGANGEPNLVEEGEVKWNDYIFSDRMTLGDMETKNLFLPKSLIGKTFARATKSLSKESLERPLDHISRRGLNENLNRLATVQEIMKNDSNNLFANGGKLTRINKLMESPINKQFIPGGAADTKFIKDAINEVDPFEWTLGIKVEMEHTNDPKKAREIALDHLKETPNYYIRLYGEGLSDEKITPEEVEEITRRYQEQGYGTPKFKPKVYENAGMEVPQEAVNPDEVPNTGTIDSQPTEMAHGGPLIKPSHRGKFTRWAKNHGMSVGEATSKVLSNKDNYSEGVRKMAQFSRNFGGHAMGGNLFAGGGPKFPTSDLPKLPEVTLQGNPGELLDWNSVNPRVIKDTRALSRNSIDFGDTLRYSPIIANAGLLANDLMTPAEQIKFNRVSPQRINQRMTYNPIDSDYIANQQRQQGNALIRGLYNTSGGNRSILQNSLMAANRQTQDAIGQGLMQANEMNQQRRNQVQNFNRQTDVYNTSTDFQAQQYNSQISDREKEWNLQAKAARKNAIRQGISTIGTQLGNVGTENYWGDVSKNLFQYDRKGNYLKAFGGKIYKNRIK